MKDLHHFLFDLSQFFVAFFIRHIRFLKEQGTEANLNNDKQYTREL